MGKQSSTSSKIQEGGLILGALGAIGFIGIVFLMIYGNLSGNLGFIPSSQVFGNETIALATTGATPQGVANVSSVTLSGIVMTNATSGVTVEAANFTVTAQEIFAVSGAAYEGVNVNVSYIATFNSNAAALAEGVITNVSGGFDTFFGFSDTFFTIAAVVLLVFMLLGLLALVSTIMGGLGNNKFRN